MRDEWLYVQMNEKGLARLSENGTRAEAGSVSGRNSRPDRGKSVSSERQVGLVVQLTDADGASGAIAVARTAQAHAAAQCEQLSALPALNFVGGGESYGAGEARVLRRMLHFQLQSVRASVDDFDAEIESLEPEPEPEPEARKRR